MRLVVAKRNEAGQIIVDSKGLPQNTDQMVRIGSINYDYMMGIGNVLKYRDFSLSFDFDIRQGGLMFSRTHDITYFTGNAIQTAYNDRNPFVVPLFMVQLSITTGTTVPTLWALAHSSASRT